MIKYNLAGVFLLLFLGLQAQNPTAKVNPFIGTGGHGHTFPGATVPFGMVQLSPDTRLTGWDGCAGYHYSDEIVYGFSHTHLSGTGVSDYGDVLIMPTVGEVVWHNGADGNNGYASAFIKNNEKASPGYYETFLDKHQVKVQLTATDRVGVHQYTFPTTKQANVIIDLTHRDELIKGKIKWVDEYTIEGYRVYKAWAQEQHVYFCAKFSQPFTKVMLAKNDSVVEQSTKFIAGKHLKAAVQFDADATKPIQVKVGISMTGAEGARNNLEKEVPHWDFDIIRILAEQKWDASLRKIQVQGGSNEEQTVFYTALYHTMIAPNLVVDVDGQYRGTDLKVHQGNENLKYYSVFSLWDTYRAMHPLYTIIDQERTNDFVNTLLIQYQQGKKLPKWELAGNYTDCMIGYHAVSVIADAYNKGIQGFDANLAMEAMLYSANQKQSYQNLGFLPAETEAESVSKTLEYAYDDWCIAQMAKTMGDEKIYQTYIERAQYYKNVFDPTTKFMRAKMNNQWLNPFDPYEVNYHYTEANAWQYSFYVPQDISGLINLLGGKENLEAKLDELFETTNEITGRNQADITGLIGQYAHGNEPSHHTAYLYNYVGKAYKTQQRVRAIMDDLYHNAPDGLAGNENCGQMSAWYVLSAMGFYPVTPGSEVYAIGTPMFEKATVRLENGKDFIIEAKGVSRKKNIYKMLTLTGSSTKNRLLLIVILSMVGCCVSKWG